MMNRRLAIQVALLLVALAADASGRGGGGCLLQGTSILTPDGPVPIERLTPGTTVYAVVDGALATATVLAVYPVPVDEYVELLAAGRVLRVTAEHPIDIGRGQFRVAGRIEPGQSVGAWADRLPSTLRVDSVRTVLAPATAYNLLVSPGGTFIADGFVVHNKGCFLPDTPVLRADGTPAAISELRPGDKLLAFTTDGAVSAASVRKIIVHHVDEYVELRTPTVLLRVTPEHPFYVGAGTFTTVAALRPGDQVFAWDGRRLSPQPVLAIERVRAHTTVYNVQTDAPHTFFAHGLAVHNKGGGCFPAGTLVATPRGSAPIENLRCSDEVLGIDARLRPVSARVETLIAVTAPVVLLRTDRGTIAVTPDHPFALAAGGFRTAGSLQSGDLILAWQHGRPREARVLGRDAVTDEVHVFNLQVSAPHTFIANGFIVHNKGGFGGGGRGFGGGHGGKTSTAGVVAFIAVVAIVITIAWLAQRSKTKAENLDYVYALSAVAKKADKTERLLEFIAKTDPAFAPASLRQTAQATFLKLQECWQARNYEPMRPLMMPDLYAQHSRQIQGMLRNHEINKLEQLSIERIDLVNVRYTHKPEDREFTALFTAAAKDYYVDDRSGRRLRGDTAPAQFQEFWTFQLQAGKFLLREIEQTRESDVLKDDNFFEPFTDQAVAAVSGAAAETAGPPGPWLDTKTGTKAQRIERLLNFLVQTDRLWDRQRMLETARQVFTNVRLAEEAGNPDAIPAESLFPEAAADLRGEMHRRKAADTAIEYRNLCVRKVELILVRNFSDNTNDEFTVRISAHAQRVLRKQGATVAQDEYVTPFEEYWSFGRLDNDWKLKQVLPPARGRRALDEENVDQDSSAAQLKWFYDRTRAS